MVALTIHIHGNYLTIHIHGNYLTILRHGNYLTIHIHGNYLHALFLYFNMCLSVKWRIVSHVHLQPYPLYVG